MRPIVGRPVPLAGTAGCAAGQAFLDHLDLRANRPPRDIAAVECDGDDR
ncbi:hypothetical protein [Streptomyces sp. NPDC006012]